ncbi:hypothetical protein [Dysgonomonas termitidis]|uniref:Uncharacterized protein n=1 Tax=Dysgonomonas termitidis TaxID=1516126 RepID=A0ABV9KUE3_9BACT
MKERIWLIITFVVMLIGLFACKSPQPKSEHSVIANNSRADSTSRVERERARLLTVPASAASLDLNFGSLADLPIGAKYTGKQGQATVTVERISGDSIKVTANCDSLSQLIVEKETEIFHLQNRVSELEDKELKTVEVYRQTNWQIVCGWFGKVFMAVIGIGLITLFLKWKLKP